MRETISALCRTHRAASRSVPVYTSSFFENRLAQARNQQDSKACINASDTEHLSELSFCRKKRRTSFWGRSGRDLFVRHQVPTFSIFSKTVSLIGRAALVQLRWASQADSFSLIHSVWCRSPCLCVLVRRRAADVFSLLLGLHSTDFAAWYPCSQRSRSRF